MIPQATQFVVSRQTPKQDQYHTHRPQ